MALHRYSKLVDGTIPVPALLYSDEELLASQENVGVYDGIQKSPAHQSGTIHITSHRLFYIDVPHPFANSFAVDLGQVKQTEHYAGLFKSSPKVTLHLQSTVSSRADSGIQDIFEGWVCEVCGNRNPSGLSPAAARICSLCGVPRNLVALPVPIRLQSESQQHASSLPTTPLSHSESIACTACTFLNDPSLQSCEICSTPLPRSNTKSAPASRPVSPMDDNETATGITKLSFRKGGDKAFYAILKRSLKSKAWEARAIGKSTPGTDLTRGQQSRLGITGILQSVETSAQNTETSMNDAFQDLEALMVKAKEMVRLAEELNERLTASSTTTTVASSSTTALVPSTEPEEATFIRSSLSQLGLQMQNAPVTLDMIKDERQWMEELAKELGRVLQGEDNSGKEVGMMRKRGIIALDEVWGGWNRARGVALIPPSTFLLVLPHLPAHTNPPIRTRTFPSGLMVLHTPPYTHAGFSARLIGLLALSGPKTTIEVSSDEGLAIALVAEMIEAVEADGEVCRDHPDCAIRGGGEVNWWANIFRGYTWDGEV